MAREPWWKGRRGEWFVVAQAALMLLVFFGPRRLPGGTIGELAYSFPGLVAGAALVLAGGGLFVAGIAALGRNVTPFPRPRAEGTLVQTGAYRLVRHPMYGGGILLAFGWGLLVGSWLTLLYATALFVFLDVKSGREEKWLEEKFPEYAAYQRKVRRLIPFVY